MDTQTGSSANPDLRIGTQEREQALDRLGVHLAEGRLDAVEHEERADRVIAARSRGDLDRVFADLPAAPVPPRAPQPTPRPRTEFLGIPASSLVTLAIAVAIIAVVVYSGQWWWLFALFALGKGCRK